MIISFCGQLFFQSFEFQFAQVVKVVPIVLGHMKTVDNQVRVNMGAPALEPADLPFTAPARAELYDLPVLQQTLKISAVSMGNPHAVLRVDSVAAAPVARLGPLIEAHPDFPRRTNAGFMEVVSTQLIRLRVFERGVGETLACGTGACRRLVRYRTARRRSCSRRRSAGRSLRRRPRRTGSRRCTRSRRRSGGSRCAYLRRP